MRFIFAICVWLRNKGPPDNGLIWSTHSFDPEKLVPFHSSTKMPHAAKKIALIIIILIFTEEEEALS